MRRRHNIFKRKFEIRASSIGADIVGNKIFIVITLKRQHMVERAGLGIIRAVEQAAGERHDNYMPLV